MRALVMLLSIATTPAVAGSGPWVVGDGEYSLFVGGEAQRLDKLDTRSGTGERDKVDVDEGISTLGAKAILTVGFRGRFDAEIAVPVYRVHANRDDGPVCAALGPDTCATTKGVGVITLRGKGTLLDQLYGDPFTWAVGADARFGHFTAATRDRITNLGEGTLDVGGFTSVGYAGALGQGYWTGFVEVAGWYRTPSTRIFPGPNGALRVPGAEFAATSEVLLGVTPALSIGPYVQAYGRPGGVDFGQADLSDMDRFAALRVFSLRTGGTIVIRARDGLSFATSLLLTPYAANNPNTTVFSFGVGGNGFVRRRAG
jgi:hypothetical protein